MKRALNKSLGEEAEEMNTGANLALGLGQAKRNKRTVFTSEGKLEVDHRPAQFVSDRLMPEQPSNSDEESDEEGAPAVCSLKTFKNKTQTAVIEEEKEVKLSKLKEIKAKKEARAKRHQRNLEQKMEKTERAKKLEALMLDKALVQDTDALLEAQRRRESSEDGYGTSDDDEDEALALDAAFEGKRTVFKDEDNMEELEDMFRPEVAASKNGVHVVSLETAEDYKVQKAIEFKNRMFFGSAVQRMSNESFKSTEDKRRAKKSIQLARNLRLARQPV